MARTGLYKSEVKKARDSLIGQGKHPSVDAVRVELGNTGSKTTIHKYLKELEEDDGGQSAKVPLSDALQDLVARLAAQLQEDAEAQIHTIRSAASEMEERQAEEIAKLRRENATLSASLQDSQAVFTSARTAYEHATIQLQQAGIARQGLDLQLSALQGRLEENERHRLSLEEKHKHARESLEHYRTSTKEQRDQDIRRHEQQVQTLQAETRQLQQSLIVKQNEVTRLNQEGARLVSELSHAQHALYEQQTRVRQVEQKLEQLSALEHRNRSLETQIDEKDAILDEMRTQTTDLAHQVAVVTQQLHERQLELAALQAKLDTHTALSTELRIYLDREVSPK